MRICYRTDNGALIWAGEGADEIAEVISDLVPTATVSPFEGEQWDWAKLADPAPENNPYRLALTAARRHID